jgi:hypothetical protein
MFLAVINESTQMPETAVQKAVAACAKQLKIHVAPAWDMVPAPVIYYASKAQVPQDADMATILDDSDQAGFLGYHRLTPDGKPYSRVFVSPVLNHGGELLKGALSVSAVLSHEVCEWFVDAYLNLWADGPEGSYAVEICDPVDELCYQIGGVSVSDFVFRRFFDPAAPPGARFDHMEKVTKPFTPTPGGQIQVRKNGTVTVTGGAGAPDWKKKNREFPAARSARRAAKHHG